MTGAGATSSGSRARTASPNLNSLLRLWAQACQVPVRTRGRVMLEGQGLFQLAARSAAYAALARDKGAPHLKNVFERGEDKPPRLEALTVDANTTIRAMFQAAWDKVHADDNLIADDMIKHLE